MNVSERNDLIVLHNVGANSWGRDVIARAGKAAVVRASQEELIELNPMNPGRYQLTEKGKKALVRLNQKYNEQVLRR